MVKMARALLQNAALQYYEVTGGQYGVRTPGISRKTGECSRPNCGVTVGFSERVLVSLVLSDAQLELFERILCRRM